MSSFDREALVKKVAELKLAQTESEAAKKASALAVKKDSTEDDISKMTSPAQIQRYIEKQQYLKAKEENDKKN